MSGWDTSNVTDMSSMFAGCSSLASIDITDWNTSKVKYMYDMFYGCNSLVSLDLSGWDVKNAEKVSFMFFECSSLNTLDLSNWKLLNAEGTSSMFYGCTSLVSLDLSFWDISNVQAMNYMFADCRSLITLDLSGWDTFKVTDMGSMFYGCKSLTSLDLSGWDTSNVETMDGIFSDCKSLTSLDLSGWDTSKVTDMSAMFSGCNEIRQITFGSAFDCQNKSFSAPDISMLHVTHGGQDISALGEIRNFRDFEDMSSAELEGAWIRTMTLGGSGAEDSAVTDIIKVLRYEGMTQKDTNEPTDRGYAPTNVAALPVFGGSSPMSFSDADAAKAAECLSRLRAERFTSEGHSAAEVSEDADSGDLLLRDGAQTLLRLSLQRGANGSLELAFTSYAPGAVRLTLDGREYLLATPGDVNLDGTMNALDWITIMRWTLVASGGEYTSPNDEGFTIKVNGTDYNLWVLLADMTGTETDNSKNSENWGAAVNAVDWTTIMQLTLQAWKK
ncbi:MAG: BspA family leucine-rich repeat surface protein [Clostridia bacterium]|nr:BspA family leucine-rich repeat surface protein [Clostridia bacterium]